MAKRQVTAKVEARRFAAEETFTSRNDAAAWTQVVETTLEHRERVAFDLAVYATGLAASVRAHGSEYTKDKWLDVEVPPEQWAKSLPVALDDELMIMRVLDGVALRTYAQVSAKR